MSSTKATLKAAKSALDAHNYVVAADQANKILAADANNYHAQVFLGLALEKQDQYDASEAAYTAATRVKDKDLLAWQGLVSLYEKQAGKKLDQYHDAALRAAELYMEADDRIKCQSVIDKYTTDAKKYGSRAQYKHSLKLLLPSSPIYDFLDGRIPQPASTFVKIVEIVEAEENEKINTEIGQRRTRLGAKIDQVTAEVRREVFKNSPLETLYADIIDWTHDDEIRRKYEEKLLERTSETLAILPMALKPAKREQVQKLAEGLVILKHPFKLAWKIHLEWQDVNEIENLDVGLLREYIALFPDDGFAKVVRGFLGSDASPFPRPTVQTGTEEENDDGRDFGPRSEEDRLVLMTDGMDDSSTSILSHRLMGQYYILLEEYESVVKVAREGLKCILSESIVCGLNFACSLDALKSILASGLVHYQAPRHHPEARSLFEDILSRKPLATSALIGFGLIFEEQEDYAEAVEFFEQALQGNSNPKVRSEAAWCKALNGDYARGLEELEACLPDIEGRDLGTKLVRSQVFYRIGMCKWSIDSSNKTRKDRNGAYASFLASLQADMNFAPAYTSLGVYYADYAKDRKRARKCFQKAFELSASEVEAAARLANSFARSNEWDLVEVVAQRVVDSGKTKPAPGSKKKGISWPHAALGVVQLNNQDYPKSIVSFQTALRISPEDYHCWVGLGESYHNSGRYIAATKAIEHAEQFQVDVQANKNDSWFSTYMLANVKRELGEYDAAIIGYQKVLSVRPTEYGILIAHLQCLVEAALRGIELGFFGRAAERARQAIMLAKDVANIRSDAFNLWKAVGDACSIFASIQAYASNLPIQDVSSLLQYKADRGIYDVLGDVDGIDQNILNSLSKKDGTGPSTFLISCIQAAILAHKRAIHTCANDIHARAVAWYNLGWTEHQAHTCCTVETRRISNSKPLRHLKAAIQCFKRAIEMEARNAEFWNSLGIVTYVLNPKVAQHSFVRSLFLNEKSARVWTNLGALYLLQHDSQLANEAFTRAQSADPDYAQAWLGQGLVAAKMADTNEARSLFSHAFEIADSSSTMVKEQYALSTFDHLLSSSPSYDTADILPPLFALRQLRSETPDKLALQHLSTLFQERGDDFSISISSLESICTTLESEYESSESPTTLLEFAQAKADLARAQYAIRAFSSSAENAETALSLSTDEEEAGGEPHRRLRLSAHITAGLAYYNQNLMDLAISKFRTALHETGGTPALICLLSQCLWAQGGTSNRAVARDQLLDCIEKHPGDVGATTLLGAIAVIDEDEDTVEAVTADLEMLQAQGSLSALEQAKVGQLLASIAALFPGEQRVEDAEMARATAAVMLAPWKPLGWAQLARLTEKDGFPAEAAVETAVKAVPPRGTLEAGELCTAYSGTGRLDDAQRAVMVAPWMRDGWEAFM